ncbi:MAG: proprotein convertase P-domain-containing protein [Actinomycetota bacterium]
MSLERAKGQDATPCETAEFTSGDGPTPIPDNGTAEMTLTVPEGSPIQDVDVHVDIAHPFGSDLRLELVSPSARRMLLAEAVGTWGDDFSDTTFDDLADASIVSSLPPFSGQYRPFESLAVLSGTASAGTWKLKVTDLRARYSGVIDAWGLTLVTCADANRPRKRAGAPDPPPLPEGVPAGTEGIEGRLITVTSIDGGAANGDVSTVDGLETNPGPDGISLREAIEATNNDPGTYTVRFDASLKGATIGLLGGLPVLTGGGLFIDGDIDGDGGPDVTLVDQSEFGGWGFNVASSGNRLHALALQGFTNGVVFTAMQDEVAETPLLMETTFARNVVSGLVFSDVAGSISLQPTLWHQECQPGTPCRTASTWLDTRIVGNTIDSQTNGAIWVGWINDDGDVMRRVTVAGNVIRIGGEPVGIGISQGKAIDLTIGTAGQSDNRISDALLAYNAIETRGGTMALQVLAGQGGRSGNIVEDVKIFGNRVRSTGRSRSANEGVVISVSDDCWGDSDYCENVVRRVVVVGNVLEAQYVGVQVGEPCCQGIPSTLTDVRIVGNVIEGIIAAPTEFLNPWGIVI